jgi:hypothetical protein
MTFGIRYSHCRERGAAKEGQTRKPLSRWVHQEWRDLNNNYKEEEENNKENNNNKWSS